MTASTTVLTESPQALTAGPIAAGELEAPAAWPIPVPEPEAPALRPIPVLAHNQHVKRLGHWTQERHFEVCASRSFVVLDLRSPQIAAGDVEISLDIDHATVKLLVPDDAVIDHGRARRIGRGRVKDRTATGGSGGRRIVLTGEMRRAEVRVHRGGIAILSAMCSREYLADALQAWRQGRYPTIDDPSR
jgi:hypothetical protein